MKLKWFSVTNFRSITRAHRVEMSDNVTVLVGKNNEGKSNLLRALSLAMDVMKIYGEDERMLRSFLRSRNSGYRWERDFPLSLQNNGQSQGTTVELGFELSADEKRTIREEIGIRIGDTIPVRVTLKFPVPTVVVPKKGSPAFKEHPSELAAFVCKRIAFNYIPAIRTEDESITVITDIIDAEMQTLELSKKYKDAVKVIEDSNKLVLNGVAARIEDSLKAFLPNIKSVSISTPPSFFRQSVRRGTQIIIDDGNATSIELKGDGIKSLSALALLSSHVEAEKASVIAIEEPESHLHPEAIHQLNETIHKMAENNQVILSTHNPIFINKKTLFSNIVVDKGKAVPAKSIKQIRDILGLTYSDNLINANNVLVVEGEEDKKALYKILPSISEKISKAIQNNIFIIDEIGGAGNLSYKLSMYRNIACQYHVLLDNDSEGKKAFNTASSKKLLNVKNVTFINCNGFPESEFEDCIADKLYKEAIKNEYGVTLAGKEFRNNKKWSDRVKSCFLSQGKPWSGDIEKQVKNTVAELITGDFKKDINSHKGQFISALVSAIEDLIS